MNIENELLLLAGCDPIVEINRTLLYRIKYVCECLLSDFEKLKQMKTNKLLYETIICKPATFDDQIFDFIDVIKKLLKDLGKLSNKTNYTDDDILTYRKIMKRFYGYEDYIRYATMLYFIVPHTKNIENIIWNTDKKKHTLSYKYNLADNYLSYLPSYLITATRLLYNYYKENNEISMFDPTLNKTVNVTWTFSDNVSVKICNVEDGFSTTFTGAYPINVRRKYDITKISQFIKCEFLNSPKEIRQILKDVSSEFNHFQKDYQNQQS